MATQSQVNEFINLIAPYVQKKCKERGWGVPSAIIAQAGLESAWGTSGLSKTCYNYFGMKWKDGCGCGYKEYSTGEQRPDGTRYTIKAKFRKYNNVEEGIEGYFKFIESYSRYKPVIASKNYKEYATQLKSCGWATSVKYTQNIIATLEKHNLQKYDSIENVQSRVTVILPKATLRKGSIGDDVRNLQNAINVIANSHKVEVDGVYGANTAVVVKEIQEFLKKLKMYKGNIDGIYGSCTRSGMKTCAENQNIIVK